MSFIALSTLSFVLVLLGFNTAVILSVCVAASWGDQLSESELAIQTDATPRGKRAP